MMKKEEEVKTKAEESRKAEEKIQGLVKDWLPKRRLQAAFAFALRAAFLTADWKHLEDKDSNEKEIKERDKTIADKEQRIFDLKKQNLGCRAEACQPKPWAMGMGRSQAGLSSKESGVGEVPLRDLVKAFKGLTGFMPGQATYHWAA